MILIDTNVLLRRIDTTHPHFAPAVAAIAALRAAGESGIVFPQNLYEFWAAATRPPTANGLGLSAAECEIELADIRWAFTFRNDTPGLCSEWERLVTAHACRGRVAYDARLVAAMATHGLTAILTFNTADFLRFPGLTIYDPLTFPTPIRT